MSCRHVGDENSVVDVEQNKSQQAPRPNDESNWRDLARNVSTCQIYSALVLFRSEKCLRNIINRSIAINC